MRLMIIAEKYPPIVGGGETQLAQLAAGVVSMGHEVTLGTDRAGVDVEPEDRGVRVVHVPGLQRACNVLHCHEAIQSVFKLLTTEPHDALHVVNYVPALLLTWLRSAVQTPVFMSSFETFIASTRVFGMFENFPLEDALRRSVATALNPDVLFCGSNAYKRWALQAGFNERALRLIPHSTDVERFAFSASAREGFRAKRAWSPEDFVFLVPARPVPRKRIEDVLTASTSLRAYRRIRIVLTSPAGRGDLDYLHRLHAQITRDGLGDIVHWEPDLAWTDMPALYSACDAVVLPSVREGFAISLIEAMAASRPVIATNIEGPNEFVDDGVTGFLYAPGNVDQLAALMVRVMEDDTDAMSARALNMAQQRYSVASMTRRYLEVYAERLSC
jgi:glycosyltransferase involved in cell wall biosynthesis